MKVLVLACILFCASVNCQKAPFIRPCSSSDSDCLRRSAQGAVATVAAGYPPFGMKPLDPLYLDHVSASEAGLDMDFRNTVVRGLRRCTVLDLERSGNQVTLKLKCSVLLKGDYTLGGKLMTLPIRGEGKYEIRTRDVVVNVVLELGQRVYNGQSYWTVNSWRHSADVLGGVHFDFKNLFNGNKELSDAILNVANTNWHDIFQEVAPPIVRELVSRIAAETNKLFDNVPIRELSLD